MSALEDYTDDELRAELNKRRDRRRGRPIGYIAHLYGDEYDYGYIGHYIVGTFGTHSLKQAREQAEASVKMHKHGGYVSEMYRSELDAVPSWIICKAYEKRGQRWARVRKKVDR